LTHQKDMG